MEQITYKKRINWLSLSYILTFVILMMVFLFHSLDNYVGAIINLALISFFMIVVMLSLIAGKVYRLSLSEKGVTQKQLFKKDVSLDWADIKSFRISLDNDEIVLCGGSTNMSLKAIKDADSLASYLYERLGSDKLKLK